MGRRLGYQLQVIIHIVLRGRGQVCRAVAAVGACWCWLMGGLLGSCCSLGMATRSVMQPLSCMRGWTNGTSESVADIGWGWWSMQQQMQSSSVTKSSQPDAGLCSRSLRVTSSPQPCTLTGQPPPASISRSGEKGVMQRVGGPGLSAQGKDEGGRSQQKSVFCNLINLL